MVDFIFNKYRLFITSFLFIFFAGIYSYVAISKESDPDIKIPVFYIPLSLEGISPEDSELLLIEPLEKELITLPGVKKVTANAYLGGGNITIHFDAGYNLEKALNDIKDSIDQNKGELPNDAEEPIVHEINTSDQPVLNLVLYGGDNDLEILTIARKIKNKLSKIPEILDINILGDLQETVEIIIDPKVLAHHKISTTDVSLALSSANRLITAGSLDDTNTGKFSIKVPGTINTLEEVMNLPIVYNNDQQIKIRDIAIIKPSFKAPKTISRFNGTKAITLEIIKKSGANILNTIATINSYKKELNEILPKGVKYATSLDLSKNIKDNLRELQNSIFSVVILVSISLFITLGFRAGILVAISIPGSFLAGMIFLYSSGVTINMVVLFGLILSIGMLVDGTIVTVEYAKRRMSEGLSRVDAYKASTKKMFMPIFMSSLTTIIAFTPLLFWPGIVGEFMKYLPLAVITVLICSLLMATIFVPIIGSKLDGIINIILKYLIPFLISLISFIVLKDLLSIPLFNQKIIGLVTLFIAIFVFITFFLILRKRVDNYYANKKNELSKEEKNIKKKAVYVAYGPPLLFNTLPGFVGAYASSLKFFLNHSKKIIILALITVFFSWYQFYKNGKGTSFFPESEPSYANINIYVAGNLSQKEKNNYLYKVEELLFDFNNQTHEIKSILSEVGTFIGNENTLRNDRIIRITLELQDWQLRRKFSLISNDLRKIISNIKGIEFEIKTQEGGPRSGKDIQLLISGNSRVKIRDTHNKIYSYLNKDKAFLNIESSVGNYGLDFKYEVDRVKAAQYNVSLDDIGHYIKFATSGTKVTSFRPEYTDEEVDIIIRFPKYYRNLNGIDAINIETSNGSIPLSNVAKKIPVSKQENLIRYNGKKTERINVDIIEGKLIAKEKEKLSKYIDELKIPNDIDVEFTGNQEREEDSKKFLTEAFIIVLFTMFMILIATFNSFYLSIIVMSSIVLSTAGVLLGLLITESSFSIVMSGMAIISLAGIVVNNNIVLIDTFLQNIKNDNNYMNAIIRTSVSRFRPVILTSVTTSLGLLPSAFGVGIDYISREITIDSPSSQIWTLLSQNILFGLVFSTILTLIVTPCALAARYKGQINKYEHVKK